MTDNKILEDSSLINLNVGGTKYTTTMKTLRKYPHSMLGEIFSSKQQIPSLPKDKDGAYFLDANGEIFQYVLSFLRTGKLWVPENVTVFKRLEIEAESVYRITAFTESIRNFKKSRKLAKHLIVLHRMDESEEPDLVREIYYEDGGVFKPFIGHDYDGSMHISREFIIQSGYEFVEHKMLSARSLHSFLCMYRLPWFSMKHRMDWVKNWSFEWYRRV